MAQSNGASSVAERFRGLIAPIPTVFDGQGEVDVPMMRELTDWYIGHGVNGFFVLGSQGQGPACRPDQRKEVAEAVVGQANGRVVVTVQVGAVDPYTSMDLGRHAKEVGADAIGIVGPYYYSDRSEWELIEQHKMVNDAVGLPMFLYNNPEYSGYPTPPSMMLKLKAEIPGVFGAKLAAGTLEQAREYIDAMGSDFNIFIPVNQLIEGMRVGVCGSIAAGPPVVMPEVGVALVQAIRSGDEARAQAISDAMSEHSKRTASLRKYGRASTLVGLQARGLAVRQYPRWKTMEMTQEDRDLLANSINTVLETVAVPV